MEDNINISEDIAKILGMLQMENMTLKKQLKAAQEEIDRLKHGKSVSKTV
jgi:hypothetical protein